jgi:branched-subunit amino acid transport protein
MRLHLILDEKDERPSSEVSSGCFPSAHGCIRVGPVSQPNIRGDLDRDRGLEHRRLDVQRRIGLAHDEPQPGPVHRLHGAGSQQSANVSVRDSGGCACGHRGPAPPFDHRRVRDHDHLDRLRRARLASPHHTGQPVGIQLHRDRGLSHHGPRVAGGGAGTRAETGSAGRRCGKQRGHQRQPRRRTGNRRSARRGDRNCGAVLGQCVQLGVIVALVRWRLPKNKSGTPLPPERFGNAMRTGLRHARYNPNLNATLIRATAFFVFASAYWALLPLVTRSQIAGGPALYGLLLGIIGASAVGGAFLLRWLREKLGADRLLSIATLASAVATGLFALAHDSATAVVASLIAGASWISAVASLNVSAQIALPEWVRGRGLAVYVTVMFGALTIGSAIWGELAAVVGLTTALLIAAAGAIIAIPLTRAWKVQTGAVDDLSPSMHWPAPITTSAIEPDRGPVLVTVEYHIDPKNREPFLHALGRSARVRRRDGAYDWGIFEDPAKEGRFIETFLTDSWLDHLRQHQRVTKADRIMEQLVRRFQVGDGPKTTHLIGAQPRR